MHQVPTTPSPRSPLCPPLRISTYHDIELGETAIFTDDTAIQLHRQRTRNRDASSAPNRPEGCLRSSWRIQDPILHHHPTQTSTSIPPQRTGGRLAGSSTHPPDHIAHTFKDSSSTTTWTTREKWKRKVKVQVEYESTPLLSPLYVCTKTIPSSSSLNRVAMDESAYRTLRYILPPIPPSYSSSPPLPNAYISTTLPIGFPLRFPNPTQ